ncbi:MAG: hypothetical protein AUJ96_29630 [Armatimonadetes bacterium CG2_30_66_41]|nr:inositol monophosphatase [Armatimonadota bacterium]NCO95335.1 inositol monophosphatase [Armatimonadota bacterium]NCP28402.1 inositol monophosphatase [Armatimonadota bacterium]NDK13197.1 inositol monophosphatase [Armatimonadota bacterium]OIO93813.1 MAG: hypothetical protein AUJ96_29630 [Armatimonadetes bacterium CG2_30_66_41]
MHKRSIGEPDLDLRDALAAVRAVAAEQAAVLLRQWSSSSPVDDDGGRDFTTRADIDVERNIRDFLRDQFPAHGFSGEETGDDGDDAEYRWLVDPIDGTKYYAAESSLFSVSIALLRHGAPVLGVVQDVCAGKCFSAHKGGGAFVDGRPLRGSRIDVLRKAIVSVDTPNSDVLPQDEREWFEGRLVGLTRHTYRVRALGAGALAACWVATGALDAYVDLTGYVKPQDLAAGWIIMEEAGLHVEHLHPICGPPRLVAAPERLWAPLVQVLDADLASSVDPAETVG